MILARCFASAIVLLGTASGALAQAALQPHVAAYRLDLDNRSGPGILVAVRGGLVIEWSRECEGWASRQRLGFVARTDGGDVFNHDVRFTSWEATDGSRMRYVVRSFEDDTLKEEFRGIAELGPDASGVADFSSPEAQEVELPPGTVFPTEHINLVLAAAEAGDRFVSHEVFDGYGFDALTQVTSVIGAARAVEVDDGIDSDLVGKMVWPVNMAYYRKEGEGEPEFQAIFLLDDQGILYDVLLDYGDFRLEASLEVLELLDSPDC